MKNYTEDYDENDFPKWLHGTLYFLIGLLAICGNVINILVVPKLTSFPESAKAFIGVLSGCDGLLGIVLLVTSPSAWLGHWLLGDKLCKLFAVIMFFAAGCGGSILLFLNIDRWYAIAKPFMHIRHVTKPRVYVLCAVALFIWLCSALLYASSNGILDNVIFSPLYRKCFIELTELEGFYAVFLSMVLYSQCLAIVLVYAKILHISRRHKNRITYLPTSHTGHSSGRTTSNVINEGTSTVSERSGSDSKAIRTTLLVTGAFLGSWLPYTSSIVLNIIGVNVPPEVHALCSLAVVCNSWWNTVVYSICNRNFRKQTKKMFKTCLRNKLGPGE